MMRPPIKKTIVYTSSRKKEPKKPKTPFDKRLLKPDPDFKDERVRKFQVKQKNGFLSRFIESISS